MAKYKRHSESFRSYKTKLKSYSRKDSMGTKDEPRFTLTSPIEWQTSPLSSVSVIATASTKSADTSHQMLGNTKKADGISFGCLENQKSSVATKSSESSFIINFDELRPNVVSETLELSRQLVCCRYCLSNDSRKQENLISPCLCAGSSKYVHTSCLEKWLTLRNISECEVCKTQYKTKWIRRPFCSLRFPAMTKKDVVLHFITIWIFFSLIFQFLGLIYVSMVTSSLPGVERIITLIGLSLGLFWLMIGCITMSIVLHTSPYWHKFRNMNKRKVILLPTNNNFSVSDNEFLPLANSTPSIPISPMIASNVDEIDYTRPVPV